MLQGSSPHGQAETQVSSQVPAAKKAVRVAAGESVALRWSIGNTRSIPVGTRAFILKQGDEPRGLVASGWTTREPFEDLHYDPPRAAVGETAFYVEIAPDVPPRDRHVGHDDRLVGIATCRSSAPF